MTANATLRYLRMSPRKVRLVADFVRGLPVERALIQLDHLSKEAAAPVAKLIRSAIANAVTNHGMLKEGLVVHRIAVNEGPTMKRFTPKAQGRATPIRKRMSHVHVTVAGASVAEAPSAIAPKKRAARVKTATTSKKNA